MSPQCRMKRSTAAGRCSVFSVVSVITEISEKTEALSRGQSGDEANGRGWGRWRWAALSVMLLSAAFGSWMVGAASPRSLGGGLLIASVPEKIPRSHTARRRSMHEVTSEHWLEPQGTKNAGYGAWK